LLGELSAGPTVVVADFDAGLGTVLRVREPVDLVLVVAEPTARSLEVARRAAAAVAERELGEVLVVANRIRTEGDLARVRTALPGHEVVPVPEDPALETADRAGLAPLDVAPQAPAVQALVALAERVGRAG
jgi:CO dehydrogenase maturation factor